jgi:hypothetical protein
MKTLALFSLLALTTNILAYPPIITYSCTSVNVSYVAPFWQVQCGQDEIFKNGFEG